MRTLAALSAALCAAVVASCPDAGAGATPLTSQLVASGLVQPLYITHVPGDRDRLFIVEKPGRIRIVENGALLPTPFLDITSIVNATTLEWGLLGLEFHPDYATNGLFYVHYSGAGGDCYIARFQVSAGDPDVADASSRQTILFLDQPSANHRGGWLGFGPDGYLYISFGDGGGQQDPFNRAQNLALLQGKILRVDVNSDDFPAEADRNYAIPADNPFAMGGGAPEIWAYGLRNPWRCSFDRETGDLWIGDVGQFQREEIDFQPAGEPGGRNYGWRCTEGTFCTGLTGCTCNGPTLTPPIYEYNHTVGVSITGGYVYRGCAMPDMRGTYFFAEYQLSRIFSFRYENGAVIDFQDRTAELDPVGALDVRFVATFGEDADGELYMVDYNAGEVFKIVPNGVPAQECPCPGDLNGDMVVNFGDLNILLDNYNETGANVPGDLDGSGTVDFADLNLLLGLYNVVC